MTDFVEDRARADSVGDLRREIVSCITSFENVKYINVAGLVEIWIHEISMFLEKLEEERSMRDDAEYDLIDSLYDATEAAFNDVNVPIPDSRIIDNKSLSILAYVRRLRKD